MQTLLLFIFSGVLVVLDQWTKYLAVTFLKDSAPVPIWPDVFELHFLEQGNDGVAWGMLSGQMWLIIPLTCFVIVLLTVVLLRSDLRHSKLFSISCAMILAGGIGNLIDRVLNGAVVDFLYFKLINFPIFNFADCCVVVGAILLFVYIVFFCKEQDLTSVRGMIFGTKTAGRGNDHDSGDKALEHSGGAEE